MKKIMLIFCLLGFTGLAFSQQPVLKGTVRGEDNFPLPGVFLLLKDTEISTVSDESGKFSLMAPEGTYTLLVSYIGMENQEIPVILPAKEELEIILKTSPFSLESVEVVSTGYQTIPKERASGSFAFLDSQLVNRKVSTNILDRLEDVTPGLIFNRGPQSTNDPISIRGRGTIFANTTPLIIIDNFPYDGPLENINPNDIASITVLRDAAAASIWGARAGNGVIVITTHQGKRNQSLRVSLNSNVSTTEARDLFYLPQMSIPDFIDIERTLFGRNFYRSLENNSNKPALSPAVETLIALRNGQLTQSEADAELMLLGQRDIRRDLTQFYLRPSTQQQYSLSISGGGINSSHVFSLGYDHGAQDIIGNDNSRWTLSNRSNWDFLDNKIQVGISINLANQNRVSRTSLPTGYAYDRLVDDSGNPLSIANTYSTRYIASVANRGLLDWSYIPLNELGALDFKSQNYDLRLSPSLKFNIAPGLELGMYYQYWRNLGKDRNRGSLELFSTRDIINRYTQEGDDGQLSYPVPVGDILSISASDAFSHTLRPQLSYSKNWGKNHSLNVLTGAEVRDLQLESSSSRYYGYRDDLASTIPVDLVTRYPFFHNRGQQGTILSGNSLGGRTDRFVSYYGNLGYDLKHTYFLSGSIRKDQSNIFGIEANRRGVPLWSLGGSWILSENLKGRFPEFPFLKLRVTYGSAGNVDKSLSSQVTAQLINFQFFDVLPQLQAATIVNPPNPNLRWEQIKTSNFGVDLESQSGWLRASFDLYQKNGTDLLGEYSVPSSLGLSSFTGNFAQTQVRGMELDVTFRPLRKALSWSSTVLLNSLKEKVIDFERKPTVANLLGTAFSSNPQPIVGRPLYGIYTYEWGGLDPQTGNPMGILNNEPSMDYLGIIRAATIENLQYHGPARPTTFGSFRNDFSYKGFSLSVNISYRLGYFYKRRSIDYFTLLRGEIGHGDFDHRWKAPGDEIFTEIPSLPATADTRRNNFYSNSGVLVERGDHFRLNDVRLSYTWDRSNQIHLPFKTLQIYTYANNLGILWKASNDSLDPDFQTAKPLTSFSAGLKIDF